MRDPLLVLDVSNPRQWRCGDRPHIIPHRRGRSNRSRNASGHALEEAIQGRLLADLLCLGLSFLNTMGTLCRQTCQTWSLRACRVGGEELWIARPLALQPQREAEIEELPRRLGYGDRERVLRDVNSGWQTRDFM
jgi:hypothetical protein